MQNVVEQRAFGFVFTEFFFVPVRSKLLAMVLFAADFSDFHGTLRIDKPLRIFGLEILSLKIASASIFYCDSLLKIILKKSNKEF